MADKSWFKKHPIWTAIIGFFALIFIISLFSSNDNPTSSTQSQTSEQIQGAPKVGETETKTRTQYLSIGEEGRLYMEGYTTVPVCKTKEYFDELADAVVAKDEIGYGQLLTGKCYGASTLDDFQGDYYGRVLILDKDWGATKFRFIHPDALHYGETAWTYDEYIIPIR